VRYYLNCVESAVKFLPTLSQLLLFGYYMLDWRTIKCSASIAFRCLSECAFL